MNYGKSFSLLNRLKIDDYELLKYAFSYLKKEQQDLLKKAFGDTLLEEYQSCNLTKEESKNSIYAAILSLRNRIKNTTVITVTIYPKCISLDSNNFFEKFGYYHPKDVLKAFNQLDVFCKEVFYKMHGPFLLEDSNYNKLTVHEKEKYDQGLLILQKELSSYSIINLKGPTQYVLQYRYSPKQRGTKAKNLLELNPDYSFEEIVEAVSKLRESDQQLLKKAYGDNYDSVIGRSLLDEKEKNHLTWVIRGPLNNFLNNSIDVSSDNDLSIIFSLYPNYSKRKILRSINLLSDFSISLLKKAYGKDFSDNHLKELSNNELLLLEIIQDKELKEILENGVNNMGNRKINSVRKNIIHKSNDFLSGLSDDIIHDRLTNLPYKKMTQEEESDFIKKTKLSYYLKTDDLELRESYLVYYKEMFPDFREAYDKADSSEKERLLKEAIQNSLIYRESFINNNLRLVFSIAKRYSSYSEFENLFQEGIVGMMRALEKFDVSLGFRFSTYATWWIRQSITRYLAEKNSMIRVPVQRREQLNHLAFIKDYLTTKLGYKPEKEDIAEEMGLSVEKVEELINIKDIINYTSLDEPIHTADVDDDTTIGDFVASDENVDEEVESSLFKSELMAALKLLNLSPRDRKILYMRYGFYNNRTYTLEEIGKEFGLTRERIRQIEARALQKLRNNAKLRNLYHDYFGDEPKKNIHVIKKRVFDENNLEDINARLHDDRLVFDVTSSRKDVIVQIFLNCDQSVFNEVQLEILRNRYIGGLSRIDTAKIMGISLYSVERIEEESIKMLYEQITDVELASGGIGTGKIKSLKIKK